jgi:hypothetical protein
MGWWGWRGNRFGAAPTGRNAPEAVQPGPQRATRGPAARRRRRTYAIQPLYVLPRDGEGSLGAGGTIGRSVAAMQPWFTQQAGGARLRFVAGSVPTVCLPETDAQIAAHGAQVRDRLEELLRGEGYDDPHRLYAVWYDGTSTFSCGGGAWPPELLGHVAALYLQGHYTADGQPVDCSHDRFSSDGTTVEINELKMLHEILHTLGLVGRRAPHHTRDGHTSDDPTDLMYAGPLAWEPSVLDVGHDDYYLTGRTDIPDLSPAASSWTRCQSTLRRHLGGSRTCRRQACEAAAQSDPSTQPQDPASGLGAMSPNRRHLRG